VAFPALLGFRSAKQSFPAGINMGFLDFATLRNHYGVCPAKSYGKMDTIQVESTLKRDAI
jgi:hypothetical protein